MVSKVDRIKIVATLHVGQSDSNATDPAYRGWTWTPHVIISEQAPYKLDIVTRIP